MSFWCFIGLHDWEYSDKGSWSSEDKKKTYEVFNERQCKDCMKKEKLINFGKYLEGGFYEVWDHLPEEDEDDLGHRGKLI